MSVKSEKNELSVKEVKNRRRIMSKIHIGSSIPILPPLRKYIERNLKRYKDVAAFHLEENMKDTPFGDETDRVVGHCLVFNDGSDTLFFGYFSVYDHTPEKIEFLLGYLQKYAEDKGYKRIRGPINIPAHIFGLGFMEKGSHKEPFIGRPVNPPVYNEIFEKNGFGRLHIEDQYRCTLLHFDPYDRKNKLVARYDFSDYEYINPEKKEDVNEFLDALLELHVKYMPPSALVTPTVSGSAEDVVDFIFEFGMPQMIWAVKYKPTGEIVAGGYVLPNIFSADRKGRPDSISMHDWVTHPDHRRKGLTLLMYGMTSLSIVPPGKGTYTWGIWQVGRENIANTKAALKMGGILERSLIVYQKEI